MWGVSVELGVSVLWRWAAAVRKINWQWLKGDGFIAPDFGNDGLGAVLDGIEKITFMTGKDGKGEQEWCEEWGQLMWMSKGSGGERGIGVILGYYLIFKYVCIVLSSCDEGWGAKEWQWSGERCILFSKHGPALPVQAQTFQSICGYGTIFRTAVSYSQIDGTLQACARKLFMTWKFGIISCHSSVE